MYFTYCCTESHPQVSTPDPCLRLARCRKSFDTPPLVQSPSSPPLGRLAHVQWYRPDCLYLSGFRPWSGPGKVCQSGLSTGVWEGRSPLFDAFDLIINTWGPGRARGGPSHPVSWDSMTITITLDSPFALLNTLRPPRPCRR